MNYRVLSHVPKTTFCRLPARINFDVVDSVMFDYGGLDSAYISRGAMELPTLMLVPPALMSCQDLCGIVPNHQCTFSVIWVQLFCGSYVK
jgi:hypothetical protein